MIRRFTPLVAEIGVASSAGVAGMAGIAGVVGGAAEAVATTGEGGGACEVPTAAGGVDSRLIGAKSEGGGAEEGEGAQIGGGGGWDLGGAESSLARKLGIVFGLRSIRSIGPYKYRPTERTERSPKKYFQFGLVYGH
jgi:hypothetical protein